MKAWVLRGYDSPLAVETVPDPAPGPADVVIRVRRCGVCNTDLKIASGKLAHVITLQHVPGHEVAGEVVALASEVRGLSVGDRGTVFHYQSCRDCPACRTGRENVCHHIRRLGFELPGGFAEYVRAGSAIAPRIAGKPDPQSWRRSHAASSALAAWRARVPGACPTRLPVEFAGGYDEAHVLNRSPVRRR
jgi:D-arabinose 1-dehydrogenase-like Zn-dependent alcohol dehydrogenase